MANSPYTFNYDSAFKPLFNGNAPIAQPQPQQLPQPVYAMQAFNPVDVGFQRDLLHLKDQYNTAEQNLNNYNNLLAGGNLSDAETQKFSTLRNMYQNSLSDIANSAKALRNTASTLGVNVSGFGADDQLDTARQQLLINDSRNRQALMTLPSIEEQKKSYYDEMRSRGLSPRLARRATMQKADAIRDNYNRQLTNGIISYGQNNDGSLNAFGMAMLGRMLEDNPQATATLFSNGFALPRNVYEQEQQNYRTLSNIDAQLAANDARLQSAWDLANYNQNYQREKDAYKQTQDAIKNEIAMNRNEIYRQRALANEKTNDENTREDKKTIAFANGAFNMSKEIDNLIMNNKFDEAREKYLAFKEYMADNQKIFYEGFNDDTRNLFSYLDGMFNDFFGVNEDEEIVENSDLTPEEQIAARDKQIHDLKLNYLIKQGQILHGLSNSDARDRAMQILNIGKHNSYPQPEKKSTDFSQANKNVSEILNRG